MTALALWPILRRFWWILPLALALAWVARIDHLRAHWKSAYEAEHKAYGIFRAEIIDKSAEALAAQKAVNAAKEKHYEEVASQADTRYADLNSRYRSAVLRLQAGSGGSAASSPAQGSGAGVSSQATGSPELSGGLCISDADALKVADLAAYARSSYEWAATINVAIGPTPSP
jgi:uncharacterized protein YdbL (DUF1318 family)